MYIPLTQPGNMSAGKVLLVPLLLLATLTGSQCDIDIGFVIESSGIGPAGSVNYNEIHKWSAIKGLVYKIITGLPRNCTNVGFIIFSKRSDLVLLFKSNNATYPARDYVLTLNSHGSGLPKNTTRALYMARNELFNGLNGDREDAHNVAVLITHSKTENPDRTISMAQELHKHGVKVISVGITNNTDQDILMAISSPPHIFGDDYHKVSSLHKVNSTADIIVKHINSYKRASFRENVDIGFIIDSSGSISYKRNWHPLLKVIGRLIDQIPRVGTQVGAVIYSDSASVLFSLDRFKDLCDVKHEILHTKNVGHGTNTAAGLHIAQTELFNVNKGDRQDVPNVAILITDGRSSQDPFNNDPNDMTLETARALHRNGVKVICIGITNKINEDELREISSPPHQKDVNYFIVSDAEQLEDIIDVLLVHIDPGSDVGAGGGTDTSLVLYIVVPVLGGLLIVAVMLIVGCILYKKRKRVAGTGNEASGDFYENHTVGPTTGIEKNTRQPGPVYEEAVPAHLYDDANSTLPHPRQPVEPDVNYSNATRVHPPIYELAGPSDGAYSQVTPAAAPQQQPTKMESLYSQVQRKKSYIYAQVQKKKSYIYA